MKEGKTHFTPSDNDSYDYEKDAKDLLSKNEIELVNAHVKGDCCVLAVLQSCLQRNENFGSEEELFQLTTMKWTICNYFQVTNFNVLETQTNTRP